MSLAELYGMSESSGPHTLNLPGFTKVGTVGRSMPGSTTIIDKPDQNKGEGEICMRGRHIMMGYMFNKEATQNTIDQNGYLHSGDLGTLDSDGFLKITGRIKELIITAGGENIPPVLIEDAIKLQLPIISNVMVIGDQKKYLTCLITLKTEIDESTGETTQQLTSVVKQYCQSIGSNSTTTLDIINDLPLKEAIMNGIEKANQLATSRAQRVQKFNLLKDDFQVSTGELTPTMKLKRRIVAQKYQHLIEKMYHSSSNNNIPAKL